MKCQAISERLNCGCCFEIILNCALDADDHEWHETVIDGYTIRWKVNTELPCPDKKGTLSHG